MPELPEVETIRRQLRKSVTGKRIEAVRLSGLPLRRPVEPDFAARLSGRTIRRIFRRGKYLLVEVEPRGYWLIHLGMSGRIFYHPQAGALARHIHAAIRFSDGTELCYCDPRRFGLLEIHDVRRAQEIPAVRRLGADPLSPGFDAGFLRPLLQNSRREIKSFLLDQHRIAGLGNIYACEALHIARVHPRRRCNTLTPEESARLARAIRSVLETAVCHRGTSFSDFVDSGGQKGDHQNHLRVYQRKGRKCRRCGALVERIAHGNRSSFFCPRCQI